jgi:hypothetical protein
MKHPIDTQESVHMSTQQKATPLGRLFVKLHYKVMIPSHASDLHFDDLRLFLVLHKFDG